MVKGVAAAQPESAPPQRLPAMQAGQNPSDPLTMLNTPMAHGALAGFNPFTDMGINPNDPNMVRASLLSLKSKSVRLTAPHRLCSSKA